MTVATARVPAQLRRDVEGLELYAAHRDIVADVILERRGEGQGTLRHRSDAELEAETLREDALSSKAVVLEDGAGDVSLDDGLPVEQSAMLGSELRGLSREGASQGEAQQESREFLHMHVYVLDI